MESVGPSAGILIFILLILFDFIFYSFSAAIQNLNENDVEKKATEDKDKKSIRLLQLMEDPNRYVNTLQVVVTLIHLIIGAFYIQVREVIPSIITFFVILFVLLTFGILIPKHLGKVHSEKWSYACINFAYYIIKLLRPLTFLVSVTSYGILRLFGMKSNRNMNDVTEEEIISMVNEGHEQGVLQESEAQMITNIFEFCDKEVNDIMTNRQNIVGLPANLLLKEALAIMLEENNSRYPVYQDNIDHIIGLIHLKDAVRKHNIAGNDSEPIDQIEGLIRDVDFVPETKNIDDLFREMQSKKTQMAIVIDEYGQTAGLVAMEDILEEIVGNIEDEYDEEEEHIEETGTDEYLIEGMTTLEELEEKFNISFDEEEFETLNGYLISKMDKIPEENEDFDIDVGDYNFKIMKVENQMIQEVLVTRKKQIEKSSETQ